MKAFLDITPSIIHADGTPIELGTVRYEIEAKWKDFPHNSFMWTSPATPLDYTGWIKVQFAYRLTSAEKPQPQRIVPTPAHLADAPNVGGYLMPE